MARGGRLFRYRRKKVCKLCKQKKAYVDYKDVEFLKKYIPERGKILPRRTSGNCAKHQRMLTTAIKRAREMALIPYVAEPKPAEGGRGGRRGRRDRD